MCVGVGGGWMLHVGGGVLQVCVCANGLSNKILSALLMRGCEAADNTCFAREDFFLFDWFFFQQAGSTSTLVAASLPFSDFSMKSNHLENLLNTMFFFTRARG